MSKTRAYVFTINNPSISDDLEIELLKDKVDYLCYGREVGDLGTYHYQGYCKFPHPVTLQRVSSLLGRAHIERAKGNAQQNIDYCSKDGNFIEHGTRPTSAKVDKKQMWKDIIKCAETGDLEKIKEDYPHAYFLHFKKIQDFRNATWVLSKDNWSMNGGLDLRAQVNLPNCGMTFQITTEKDSTNGGMDTKTRTWSL